MQFFKILNSRSIFLLLKIIISENHKMIIFTSSTRYKFNIGIISSAKKSRTAAVILVNHIHGFIQKFQKLFDLLVTEKPSVPFYSEMYVCF